MTANVGAAEDLDGQAGGITLFGMTFTSKTLGIILGVVGVGLAAYLTANYSMPLFDSIGKNSEEITKKGQNVEGLKKQIGSKGDVVKKVEEAQRNNGEVLALLPSADSMDTLLADLNKLLPEKIKVANEFGEYQSEGLLEQFKPTAPAAVEGAQYRTYTFGIQFSATYQETVKILQNIERLKPLLVLKDLQLKRNESIKINTGSKLPVEQEKAILATLPPLLTVGFNIVAYVPFSEAELKALDAAAAAKAAPPK